MKIIQYRYQNIWYPHQIKLPVKEIGIDTGIRKTITLAFEPPTWSDMNLVQAHKAVFD